jgi:hypothetical protein
MVPKKISMHVTVSEDTRAELVRLADEQRQTLSALVDRILFEWLRAKDRRKKRAPRKSGETV